MKNDYIDIVTIARDKLLAAIDSDCSEEEVHQLFSENPIVFGLNEKLRYSNSLLEGMISKFPISPDRIPDFILINLGIELTQTPHSISIIELKRVNAKLFLDHNRMSKDLNDSWMECIESFRILGLNYQDFLRRLINKITDDFEYKKYLEYLKRGVLDDTKRFNSYYPRIPRIQSKIIIGRRKSLTNDDLLRIQELSASTNWAIGIETYDSIIDRLNHIIQYYVYHKKDKE
ncbi:MAG: DUF4263 domain-containing protein [Candidatus Atribacteria bacterium]|nr:DUF4263 domain-containing protein [Candidatus Atribacteria bacterium]